MGKKKRQGEPNAEDSSDSSKEYQNACTCTHVAKALDFGRLKKLVVKATLRKTVDSGPLQQECEECKKEPGPAENPQEYDPSLWMCLKCGNLACGRYRNQHALQHFKTPHSDLHSLCLNTTNWNVWCYDCDDEVNVNSKKTLLDCVEYIKRQAEGGKTRKDDKGAYFGAPTIEDMALETKTVAIPNQFNSINNSVLRARGLVNLGNTCFFNSVMQCLGHTPYLLELLQETSTPGQYFKLPGGSLCLDDEKKQQVELEPLEGELEEWRPLTKELAKTLDELKGGRGGVYDPRYLLSYLTKRMPQFGGGDQHDSHELLRHLLEAVREEDLRRYQVVILEKLGFNRKTDPTSVEGVMKKRVRFFGGQASELLLPTEQVFRGVLVSTLQCQDCEHTSHRDEFFLDLSLPISEKQTPPILRRKAEELDDNRPSKHQIKKERKQAKKNNKLAHWQKNWNSSLNKENDETPMEQTDKNSESESDADVEDNVEDSSNNVHTPEDGPTKGTESGYNSDKNGSPENVSPDMCVDDSGVPSPAVGMLSASPLGPSSPDSSPASSEANIHMGSPLGGRNTPEEINEEYERPESRLSFVHNKGNDLKVDLEKLSIKTDSKNNELDNRLDGAYGGIEEDEDDKMDIEESEDLWSGTISARYKIEDGECSVESCLNQFTTSELMTANNKVSCELCTKRHGGPDKKTFYTNATKQLLIYNPPAVLILHLKRFQVYHFRPTKMSKHVKFPTLLDLAPFCSKRSKNLPTFDAGQKQVLYSLYGVVEHIGTMHGGHYVAYVKVRPKLAEDSYRWHFLPKNQKKDSPTNYKENKPQEPPIPQGKWYYISDSYATEVMESKVLDANAYLLFYERIL